MSIDAAHEMTVGVVFLRSPLKNFAVIMSVAAGLIGAAGCRPEESTPPRQAILIMLDAARPDRFSSYGYERATTPEMDRLASNGVLFRHHFAQGTSTRVSVTSLMNSRFYCTPLFPNNPRVPYSNPSSLFRCPDRSQISFVKVLESNGFKTAAISAHTWTGENTDFAAEFSEMHDLAARFGTRQRPKPSAKIVADHAISWIRENKDRDYFLYIHLMDTHAPHFFEGDAQRFFGASSYAASSFAVGGTLKDRNSVPSGEDRRYANALYDGSLRYADRHIGRVVEFLRQGGLLDSTILAITSDHGELIFEHPGGRERKAGYLFSHGGPWYDPLAKIPLIIHYPRTLESVEFDHFSEGVDVGPTLLSLLEVPVPAGKKFDGVDLVQVIKGKVPPKDHVLERGSIRTDKYKCIFLTPPRDVLLGEPPPDPDTLGGELYDLVADPRELINLFESKPETVRDLLRRFRASMAARFQRYEAARCSEQPRSAFAIAARHLQSDKPLPEASGRHPWYGWVRLMRGGQLVLAAGDTNEPLAVHCPLPNGIYELSLDLHGHVVIEIDDQVRELHAAGVVEFGVIVVKDEVFRATIRPVDNKQVSVKHFGFIPSIADTQDSEAAKEQLERLRALGYID